MKKGTACLLSVYKLSGGCGMRMKWEPKLHKKGSDGSDVCYYYYYYYYYICYYLLLLVLSIKGVCIKMGSETVQSVEEWVQQGRANSSLTRTKIEVSKTPRRFN